MTPKRVQDKRDPELWVVGDVYYYRGRPTAGASTIERSLGVKVPERGNALRAKKDLLIELRGLDPAQKEYLFRDVATAVLADYDQKIAASQSEAFADKIRRTREQVSYFLGTWLTKSEPPELHMGHLLGHFEHFELRMITEEAWKSYCDDQLAKKKRLLKYDRRFMKMALLRAQRAGKLVAIPELRIPDSKRRVKKRRVFTPDEMKLIYGAASGVLKPLVLIMYKMGFRPGEALKLTWNRVDFEKNTILLREEDVKAGARTVSMNPQVRAMLIERKLKTKGICCFPAKGTPDKPVHRYQKQWKRLLTNLTIEADLDPYCLRHTFLTEAAKRIKEGKASIVEVTQYAGTSIREFERTYLHMVAEDTKHVASIMDLGGAI